MATLEIQASRGLEPLQLIFKSADNLHDFNLACGVPHIRVDGSHRAVFYPPDPVVVQRLTALLHKLDMSPDTYVWYTNYQSQSRHATAIADKADSYSPLPWADRLYPYQRVGAEWLNFVDRGILGDDPGLGKTVQALTAVHGNKDTLIVTMPTVMNHWQRHIEDWLGQDVAVAQGGKGARQRLIAKDPHWLIVNHAMLRTGAYPTLATRRWDSVIIDEAHLLQGKASQQSKGADALKSDGMFLLTGTPIWNKPDSLWHLLHLLYPQRFKSYWRFVGEYCLIEYDVFGTHVMGVNPERAGELQEILVPLLLRRTKKQVLPSLPDKIYETLTYELTGKQRQAYRTMKAKLRLVNESGVTLKTYDNSASVISDLRLLCDAPSLVDIGGESPKDDVIDDLLASLLANGRKVVIFTWHKTYAYYLAGRLNKLGTVVVTGDTEKRDYAIQKWRQGSDPILVATIASVGTGIDLVEATAAVFAEGYWTNVLNTQAEDRLHRIGQHDSPLIYRLQAANTVEDAIWQQADATGIETNELLALQGVIRRVLAQGD